MLPWMERQAVWQAGYVVISCTHEHLTYPGPTYDFLKCSHMPTSHSHGDSHTGNQNLGQALSILRPLGANQQQAHRQFLLNL